MFAKIKSHGLHGITGFTVNIEVDCGKGMPSYNTVGLPDTAVKESRDRVQSAIRNSGYKTTYDRIVINLAPADTKKEGTFYDLAIALGLLIVNGFVPESHTEQFTILGELALDGTVRRINGVLPMVIDAKNKGVKYMMIPAENIAEAACIEGINIYPVHTLTEAVDFFNKKLIIKPAPIVSWQPKAYDASACDFSLIQGQSVAKRAAEIAVSGAHNMLLVGTPGSGKTMLARSIPTIMPDLTREEAIEITKIHSVAGQLGRESGLVTERPFRSPHHTASAASLVGGGSKANPGEISLAHFGILFLDELTEFRTEVLDSLRQPLEDGNITITRATTRATYPADFMFIGAMNPCPCGNHGSKHTPCRCSTIAIKRYLQRISGPLLDRIDINVEMNEVDYKDLSSKQKAESSAVIKERVEAARQIQLARFKGSGIFYNSQMNNEMIKEFCILSPEADEFMEMIFTQNNFSGRAYNRMLKVARTIADLDKSDKIQATHVAEAMQYRSIISKYWKD